MNVPFLDLKASYNELRGEIELEVLRSLRSGQYIGGADIDLFEREFAAYVGASRCVALANGLAALQLALKALDIGPGDEVIVPSNTFIATWLAVSETGAVPIPVEPDVEHCNIDPAKIQAAITPRTKAIIPVHLYGQPADLRPILDIAKGHGLYVVEDAAQAHGSRYEGDPVGSHGDIVAWSFYPGKNLGAAGDAGAITTNSTDIADRIAMLRNYGSRQRYVNEVQGYNCRLDPVQAAILTVKLRHLPEWNGRRSRIAKRYSNGLVSSGIILPKVADWATPVWHLYCIRHPKRDQLRELLAAAGVETLVHYPIPPHLQVAYKQLGYQVGDFPIAEALAETSISLPIGPAMTDDQVEHVIETVKAAVGKLRND